MNPFRVQVASNKKILALLQDERFEHRHAGRGRDDPQQRPVEPHPAAGDHLRRLAVRAPELRLDNRERLVLKPASDYGGHGVMLGIETDQDTWEAAVAEHAERGDFIVQEYIPIPEEMFPTIEDGHVQMRSSASTSTRTASAAATSG